MSIAAPIRLQLLLTLLLRRVSECALCHMIQNAGCRWIGRSRGTGAHLWLLARSSEHAVYLWCHHLAEWRSEKVFGKA